MTNQDGICSICGKTRPICDICGQVKGLHICSICGAVYCKECSSIPDEGGCDCYDAGCPGFGKRERAGKMIF